MATLRISMITESQVRIEPVGDLSDSDWDAVIDWWSLGSKNLSSMNYIDVGLPDFSQRKIWLRENWTSLNNSLIIDDEVKVALRGVDSLITKFLEIADDHEIDIKDVNFDLIRLASPLREFQKKILPLF
jgi:hypothetical protein